MWQQTAARNSTRPEAEDVFMSGDCDNDNNNNANDNNAKDTSEEPTLAMLLDDDSNSLMLMDIMSGFESLKHQHPGAGGQQLQQPMGYGQLAGVQGAGQLTGEQNVDGSNILSGIDCGLWATSRSPLTCMEQQQQAEAGGDSLIMATGAWPPLLHSPVFVGSNIT
jgi:hypothetical protein